MGPHVTMFTCRWEYPSAEREHPRGVHDGGDGCRSTPSAAKAERLGQQPAARARSGAPVPAEPVPARSSSRPSRAPDKGAEIQVDHGLTCPPAS